MRIKKINRSQAKDSSTVVRLPDREFLELNDKEYPAQRGYSVAEEWHHVPRRKALLHCNQESDRDYCQKCPLCG